MTAPSRDATQLPQRVLSAITHVAERAAITDNRVECRVREARQVADIDYVSRHDGALVTRGAHTLLVQSQLNRRYVPDAHSRPETCEFDRETTGSSPGIKHNVAWPHEVAEVSTMNREARTRRP